ncbi:MAG: 3-carboxy-cis,cis-muconate cycloisomerase [Kiloniellales bacterium]|nr:3-carboxy-cis,cis-muconate cycloisomerase [Kiloniellales bacterium]
MSVTPLDSALYGALLSDAEVAARLDDAAQLRSMLEFEAALARVQGRLGVIPADAAARISKVAESFAPHPADLAEATARDGIPVPALVAALRAAVGAPAAQHLHWGATSQDVIDTALVLRLKPVLEILDQRLANLTQTLAALAERHRRTLMVARTRGQQAVPTSFGLKAAVWLAPLLRARQRLDQLRPRLLLLSFGGAAGTLAALGDRGPAVAEALARELGLGLPPLPWHVQRDGLAELAGWLSLVTGSLGKLGQDVLLLAQGEVSELREGGGPGRGGSSTMPNKANPVASEVLVTAARLNATLVSALHQALPQEQERGGPGWQLEWLTLPQMLVTAGCALRHAADLIENLEVDPARMRRNLEASNGLVLAEAATFALAEHLPRPKAQELVKAACAEAKAGGRHLVDLLAESSDAPVDWAKLRDPANYLGAAETLIDCVLAEVGKD